MEKLYLVDLLLREERSATVWSKPKARRQRANWR
jgi:hypothetical protein